MKNALFFSLLTSLFIGCGQKNNYHLPDTAAKYELQISVTTNGETPVAQALSETKALLLERLEQLEVTYQSIDQSLPDALITFNLIDLPLDMEFEEFQRIFLEEYTFGIAEAYRINDPLITQAFDQINIDTLLNKGLLLNAELNRNINVIGITENTQTQAIDELLASPMIMEVMPKNIKFLWGKQPTKTYSSDDLALELFGLKMPASGEFALSGKHLNTCKIKPDPQMGGFMVILKFDEEGTKIFSEMTTRANQNQNGPVALTLNGKVLIAPNVMSPILTGYASVSGFYSKEEAAAATTQLRLSKLPYKFAVTKAKTL